MMGEGELQGSLRVLAATELEVYHCHVDAFFRHASPALVRYVGSYLPLPPWGGVCGRISDGSGHVHTTSPATSATFSSYLHHSALRDDISFKLTYFYGRVGTIANDQIVGHPDSLLAVTVKRQQDGDFPIPGPPAPAGSLPGNTTGTGNALNGGVAGGVTAGAAGAAPAAAAGAPGAPGAAAAGASPNRAPSRRKKQQKHVGGAWGVVRGACRALICTTWYRCCEACQLGVRVLSTLDAWARKSKGSRSGKLALWPHACARLPPYRRCTSRGGTTPRWRRRYSTSRTCRPTLAACKPGPWTPWPKPGWWGPLPRRACSLYQGERWGCEGDSAVSMT